MSYFFFSSRRRHTRCSRDWSSDVCSSDLFVIIEGENLRKLFRLLKPDIILPSADTIHTDIMDSYNQEKNKIKNILQDRKSTRLNSSHGYISYAVFCLKKKI